MEEVEVAIKETQINYILFIGAFLIAYFTINLLVGLPCYYLELGLGQFTGNAPTHAFEMAPFWKGILNTVLIYSNFS